MKKDSSNSLIIETSSSEISSQLSMMLLSPASCVYFVYMCNLVADDDVVGYDSI